ncbi:unnamed protein product, partial [Gongylonema pulchrum]|uniref:Receptor protein serine/threonine kinase n=1 Tax=Gongylonema pulchrum TaxID=637853 RepID=A0A183F0Z9_9BILA
MLFVFCFLVALLFYKRRDRIAEILKPSLRKPTLPVTESIETSEDTPMFYDVSSGSGSGFASLNQRTVAQNLQYLSVIGKGRYGEVKKALYRGDRVVAVKTFYTTEEDSWRNEKGIY